MTVIDLVHGAVVHPRRARVLAAHAATLIARDAHVLDVGTGDGLLARALAKRRPDLRIDGLEVQNRPQAAGAVTRFDGRVIPRATDSVDVVTFFDVLHHADDPLALLREGARVARRCIVLKDHVCDGPVAHSILRFMDRVSNARHGVALPYNYWNSSQWASAVADLSLKRTVWQVGGLGLYPWPASLLFGRKLHLLAVLEVSTYRDESSGAPRAPA